MPSHPSGAAATMRSALGPKPVIVGVPSVGETLAVDTTEWPPGTAFGFQWYVDGEAIDGANEPRLRVAPALGFRAIHVTVYASVPRQCAQVVRSAPTRLVTRDA